MSKEIWITRNRSLDDLPSRPLNLEEAVDVFSERIGGWLLEPAATIDKAHGGFAIAAVTFPVIEVVGQVLTGRSSHVRLKKSPEDTPHGQLCYIEPNEAFSLGLRAIAKHHGAKINKSWAKILFKDLRCGVLHNGSPNVGAYLDGHGKLFEIQRVRGKDAAVVDPHQLLAACTSYLQQLVTVVKKRPKRFARVFSLYVGEKFGVNISL